MSTKNASDPSHTGPEGAAAAAADPSRSEAQGLTQAEQTGPETTTETRPVDSSTAEPGPGQPSPAEAVPVAAPPSASAAEIPIGKQPAPAGPDKVLIADSRPVEDKKGHLRSGGPGRP